MKRYNKVLNATHVYIGRLRECGCVSYVITDTQDADTAEMVAEAIRDGCNVTRVEFQRYRDVICKEDGFLSCPHTDEQLALGLLPEVEVKGE